MRRRLVHLLVRLLSKGPLMAWFRTARAWRDQVVDPQVKQLHAAVRDLRSGPVDVLFLGDSSQLWVGPHDTDRRRLPAMIADEVSEALGHKVRTTMIAGPGHNAELRAEIVRILATLPQRPRVIVLSNALRVCHPRHVLDHPEYGYRRSIENLRRIRDANGRLRSVSLRNRRTQQDFDRFHAIPVTTRWGKAATIGEFLQKVEGRRGREEDLDVQQTLFDYFFGETVDPDDPALGNLSELGRRLVEYGVPVVDYWAPIPYERGEQYFPGEFTAHVEANHRIVEKVLDDALGPVQRKVDQGHTPDDEFIDSSDASEHWNEKGRLRIARLVAAEILRAWDGARPMATSA